MSNILRTIVHLSDLHLSEIDLAGKTLGEEGLLARIWAQRGSFFDGLLGHHEQALDAVAERLDRLSTDEKAQGRPLPLLVITGDVTRHGSPGQFATFRRLLQGPSGPGIPSPIAPEWPLVCISGNHDQWCGNGWLIGVKNEHVSDYLGAFPRVGREPDLLPNGMRLVFVNIDSDAEIEPASPEGLLALGDFCDQLNEAAALLGPPDDAELRVMLLHHSRLYAESPGRCLQIQPKSREALDTFLQAHRIVLVLTGHIHIAAVEHVPSTSSPDVIVRRPPVEARCGTTTVWDRIPDHWRPFVRWGYESGRALRPNSLLIHRLRLRTDGDGVDLLTSVEQRFDNGFRSLTAAPIVRQIL